MCSKKSNVHCYCGAPARLASNAEIYRGKTYGNGKIWLCMNWPDCDGYVGTHPDGSPLGTLADKETKRLRMQIHSLIDPLWKGKGKKMRGEVYAWLRCITDIRGYHTANLNKEQAKLTLEKINEMPFCNWQNA